MQKYARDGKIRDACPNAELRSVQGRKGHARSTQRPKEVAFPLNCKSSIDLLSSLTVVFGIREN